jgi:isopenicillin-N epimerase
MIPLDLSAIGCDFYGANCHKWLLAPTGAGFLWIGPGNEDRLQPLQVSWGWHHDCRKPDEPDEFGSTPRLRALEFEGTRDCCPWLAVPRAIDFQAELGWDQIRGRIAELVAYTRQRITGNGGLPPATPVNPALHGAMTAFRLPAGTDPVAMRRGLWEQHRIEVPVIDRPDGHLIRVSTHFYNTEDEIDQLTAALPSLLEQP